MNVTKGRVVHPNTAPLSDQVSDQDGLEIQPVLVAGERP